VIERDYNKKYKTTEYYKCECRCGNKNYITTAKELLSGVRSCGCIRKKRGFNKYKIIGDTTIIYFTDRYDEIIMEGYIDTEDLLRLIKQNLCWSAGWAEDIDDYYAKASEHYYNENGERKIKMHYLHRDVMNAPKGKYVDHIEHKLHSSLDNRKINLRITDNKQNNRNKNGKHKNNKSGYRNVCQINNKLVVQLQIEGKNTVLKRFPLDQLEEAGAYAELMREKYYGEYKGIG
jgi:hypothetical protein